jgi:hypothetical protein
MESTPQATLIREHQHETQERQILSRYRSVPYLSVTFEPFMSNEDLALLKDQQNNCYLEDFKVLTIPYDCEDHVQVDVDIGGGPMAASLDPSKMLFHEDVLMGFIEGGGLHKYMSQEDRDTVDDNVDLGSEDSESDLNHDDSDGVSDESDEDDQDEKDDEPDAREDESGGDDVYNKDIRNYKSPFRHGIPQNFHKFNKISMYFTF